MNVLLIAFDHQRLESRTLRAMIESSFPGCWRQLPSCYIVRTPLTSVELRDMLKLGLTDNDELLVVTLQPAGWAWRGITDAGVDWLKAKA